MKVDTKETKICLSPKILGKCKNSALLKRYTLKFVIYLRMRLNVKFYGLRHNRNKDKLTSKNLKEI